MGCYTLLAIKAFITLRNIKMQLLTTNLIVKRAAGFLGAIILSVCTLNSYAGTINFGSYGFTHDQTLTGNEFIASGIKVSSDNRIMTPCGGPCISADDTAEGWAYGESVFDFVSASGADTAVTSFSFDAVIGNLFYKVFDANNNLFASGFGDYSYAGTTAISYFTVDYNYDGIYSITWANMSPVASVAEPSVLVLMLVGLLGLGMSRRKASRS